MPVSQKAAAAANTTSQQEVRTPEKVYVEFVPKKDEQIPESNRKILEKLKGVWSTKVAPVLGWERDLDKFCKENPVAANDIAGRGYSRQPILIQPESAGMKMQPMWVEFRASHSIRYNPKTERTECDSNPYLNISIFNIPHVHTHIDGNGKSVLEGWDVVAPDDRSEFRYGSRVLTGEIRDMLMEYGRYDRPAVLKNRTFKGEDGNDKSIFEYVPVELDRISEVAGGLVSDDKEVRSAAEKEFASWYTFSCSRINPLTVCGTRVSVVLERIRACNEFGLDESSIWDAAFGRDVRHDGKSWHYDKQMQQLVAAPSIEEVKREKITQKMTKSLSIEPSLGQSESKKATIKP